MSGGGQLHEMIVQPPRRELRALLKQEMPVDELSEEGPAEYTGLDHLEPFRRRACRGRGLKQAAGLALGALALALLVHGTAYAVVRQGAGKDAHYAALSEDLDCHTATSGERCHSDVAWAMKNRKAHPEWYIGITECSDFHDYQAFMHTQVLNSGARRCPKPCAGDESTPPKEGGKHCKVKKEKKKANCHTAAPGDDCYAHMIYTKSEAVKYPRWYPGITKESSLSDVQYYLHTERVCPMPCREKKLKKEDNITGCHTARPGDTCFADILLAKGKFIEKHPEWYKGLTKHSSNNLFQAFLHEQKHSDEESESKACPTPCDKKAMDAMEQRMNCKTAKVGDPCYESALWGATVGIRTHPEWYPELKPGSPLEDFQIHLHKDNHTKCHDLPCACQRPEKGDECYDTIKWVYDKGLAEHPDRFEGLSKKSGVDQVQQRLHELRTSACGRPCSTFDEDTRSPWKPTRTWM